MEMQFRRWGLQGDSVEGQGGISLAILTEHAPGPEFPGEKTKRPIWNFHSPLSLSKTWKPLFLSKSSRWIGCVLFLTCLSLI